MSGLTGSAFTGITLAGRRVLAQLMRGGPLLPPAVEVNGASGTTSWRYAVEPVLADGPSPLSPDGFTDTGNATLTGSNFNRISWSPFLGALSYNVYRTRVEAGGTPSEVGLIGSTDQTTFDDTGLAATAALPHRSHGISHVAIGRATGNAISPNTNVGNNFQMDPVFDVTSVASVTIHNDFAVFNFTANGLPNAYYVIEVQNSQQDFTLSFSSTPALQQQRFNHVFLIHKAAGTGGFGIGQIVLEPTTSRVPPTRADAIVYLGFVDTGTNIRNVVTACRMFDEITRVVPESVEHLDESALNILLLNPGTFDQTGTRNMSLLVTGRFGTGINDTARELGIFANDGRDLIAFQSITPTAISTGQRFRVRWRLSF